MQEMDVDGRDARFENRVGYRRFPVGLPQVFGYFVRRVECFLSRQVYSEKLETVLTVGLDEVERWCSGRERFEAEGKRSFSRFRHPEKRVRSDSFGTGQHIPFSPGLQIRFRRNANPIVGTVIRIGVQDGS